MWQIIIKGGVMMYPILFFSIIALAVIFERLYILISTKFPESETIDLMFTCLENNKIKEAKSVIDLDRTVFNSLYLAVLERTTTSEREEAAMEVGDEILFNLKKRLNILSVVGSLVPLMGLLGTVLGMITVFSRVAATGEAADITILAGGIWEALLTTAAGMAVAIPVLLAFHLFKMKIERTAHTMQKQATRMVNILKQVNLTDDTI